ncbi:MAG: DNA methyltransferase [Treponemataceae bacterium]
MQNIQDDLFLETGNDIISVAEAAHWATKATGKNITVSNITYLVNYGRIKKFLQNGLTCVSKADVLEYYKTQEKCIKKAWSTLDNEKINWTLSFREYKEAETTKHVHRLHPYKGKFIPQLVEYFLDDHIDEFKKEVFFNKGDIILDPFCGSGTTLVQSNELGMHAVGIDVSVFNTLISNVKIANYNIAYLQTEVEKITRALKDFDLNSNVQDFETELGEALSEFNKKFFPSPEFKIAVRKKEIDEKIYADEKLVKFLPKFKSLVKKYNIKLQQDYDNSFLSKWYTQNIRDEIDFLFNIIKKNENPTNADILKVILSRAMRSCRATTHSDLATIYEPVFEPYYCTKHGKICKPLFSILKWWRTYSKDTLKRLQEFSQLKTPTEQLCLTGDSRTLDIKTALKNKNKKLYQTLVNNNISGIFSSPPYVGLIDYHEQHAYAYDLFKFERNDKSEIGSLFNGTGKPAQDSYVKGISAVLNNTKKYLKENYNVFLVANDKFNLYPTIAEKAGMKIINEYHRPVLNRTEKDKSAYSEIIFHMEEK